jgi:hypothetical protein
MIRKRMSEEDRTKIKGIKGKTFAVMTTSVMDIVNRVVARSEDDKNRREREKISGGMQTSSHIELRIHVLPLPPIALDRRRSSPTNTTRKTEWCNDSSD